MITLRDLLDSKSTAELIEWAVSLDPNSSWDELLIDDPGISREQLRDWMIAAYDSEETTDWINR